jgi:nucleoid DNA-binding protein
MEEKIIALLNTNLRVIIPDFGAFIIRQKNPKIIVFNEFLRYNDGLLVDYISRTEDIDKEIAAARIAEYATEASKKLESGKVLKIAGLGTLIREPSGKINFSEDDSMIAVPSVKSEEVLLTENPDDEMARQKEAEELAKDEIPVTSKKPERKARSRRTEQPAAPAEEDKIAASQASDVESLKKEQEKPQEEKAPEEEKVKETPLNTEPVLNENLETESAEEKPEIPESDAGRLTESEEPVSAKPAGPQEAHVYSGSVPKKTIVDLSEKAETKEKEPTPYNRERKPVNVNQILLWILIILVANIAVLGYFLYGDKNRKGAAVENTELVADTNATEQLSVPETSAAPAAVTATEEPAQVRTPVSSPQQVTSAAGTRFYVVAGCFREEANADALVSSLKNKGYNAVKFGKIDDLYAVSYSSFATRAEALSELEKIRNEVQRDAWITRY